VFSIALTLSILLLSEIVPKTLGVVYWRRLWPLIVWPLTGMKYGLYPAIAVTRKLTTVLTQGRPAPPITEEEIIAMARLGAQTGEISPQESRMVHNIISLENRQVCDIMTPRTVIFSLDATTRVEEALPIVIDRGLTRIPVYEGDREHIVGYVTFQELSTVYIKGQGQTQLSSMTKDISFLSETANCLTVLSSFLRSRRHIAIVSDTYGGVAGLVTLEDLIETLLGTEIVDETDRVVDLQKSARRRRRQRHTR
jgi:CBS domain containing-hemolysin-like protein